MLSKELSTDVKVILIMDNTEERKNNYKIRQQKLLNKYHEVIFKGLPFVRFQNYVKECFESLNWHEGIGPNGMYGFTIGNYLVLLGTWQVYGIDKYENYDKLYRWDDSITYEIILYDKGRSKSVDFDAFTVHQLLMLCMTCLRQAIYNIGYETL